MNKRNLKPVRKYDESEKILKNNGKFLKLKAECKITGLQIEIHREGDYDIECPCPDCDGECNRRNDGEEIEESEFYPFKVECFVIKSDPAEEIKIDPLEMYFDVIIFFLDDSLFDQDSNLHVELKFTREFRDTKYASPFEKFLGNDNFNDFIITCADDVKIHVNRLAISNYSPILQTMFESQMIEVENNELKLSDIDGATMQEFVNFIYTGRIKEMKEVAIDLSYAAEKYQVAHLKEYCAHFMSENLSVDNAIETLLMANMCNMKNLIQQSTNFIAVKYDLIKVLPDFSKIDKVLRKDIDAAIKANVIKPWQFVEPKSGMKS